MKRSSVPSFIRKEAKQNSSLQDEECSMIKEKNSEQLRAGSIQVVRAPLFGFYQVSELAKKKFQLPAGALRGPESDELRKRKTLGARRPTKFMCSSTFSKPLQVASPPKLELELTLLEEDGLKNANIAEHVIREFEPLILWESEDGRKIEVPHIVAQWLRPHQREGVQFMFECVMSLREFKGSGCILADDMGLGKTLQSITLLWTLLCGGFEEDVPSIKKAIVVCPTSLVKNWEAEIIKWLKGKCSCLALSETCRADVIKNIDIFVKSNLYKVLVISYETLRIHVGRILENKGPSACDLLICDEAHRLKNADTTTFQALTSLPCLKRVLLSGTPLQNDLEEFFSMVDFTNPGLLGSLNEFRKEFLNPILLGREPDATEKEIEQAQRCQFMMFQKVNEFILRRTNTINAQHLPPKLVQVVCCKMKEVQKQIYSCLLVSKDEDHALKGKQTNPLIFIGAIQKLCNHPRLLVMDQEARKYSGKENSTGIQDITRLLPVDKHDKRVHPEFSGKMEALFLLCRNMRSTNNDRIVIISNYTQTLDLIGNLCRENKWPFVRLDGSTSVKKRQKLVDEFNDPHSNSFAFLLSSKAGGCGINLIGANRLVLFDPDWNPAVDKQAAARVWRDGQKKRCFVYRFVTTGTIEEKIYQRQLSKEGLQNIVDDKEEINKLSTRELRNLFKYRDNTASDTHERLKCKRCANVKDLKEHNETNDLLPEQKQMLQSFLLEIQLLPEAEIFNCPVDPIREGILPEAYLQLIKEPIDLSIVRMKLECDQYRTPPAFAKDFHLMFNNAFKVWSQGSPNHHSALIAKKTFEEQWKLMVPALLSVKSNVSTNTDCLNKGDDALTADQSSLQGQIGMPCEEDLMNWSHHYSPKTIDDECFRNALVGSDAVSFIFGLEVTWDLIQERMKREAEYEQEREAARLELKKRFEEDEIEGEVNLELESTNVPKKKRGPKKSQTKCITSPEIELDSEVEEFSEHIELDIMKPSEPSSFARGTLDEQDDDEFSNAIKSHRHNLQQERDMTNYDDTKSSKKKKTASSVFVDDDFDIQPLHERNVNVETPTQKPKQLKAGHLKSTTPISENQPLKNWECKMCTFKNMQKLKCCEVCGTSKKSKTSKENILPSFDFNEGNDFSLSGRKRKKTDRFVDSLYCEV